MKKDNHNMKIAWFTPYPILMYGHSASGTWISALYNSMLTIDNINFVNIVLSQTKNEISDNKIVTIDYRGAIRHLPPNNTIETFKKCVREIEPDLIHIWGTEWNGSYIVAKARLNVPVLVSIQGIASINKDFVKGTLRISEVLKFLTIHDLFAPSGLLTLYRDLKRTGEMELNAVRYIKYIESATPFMEAWVGSVNPQAKMFNCPSVLRPPFYNYKWNIIKVSRYTLFLPNAVTGYKGFDVVLKAAKILVKEFPLLQIRVAGPIPRKGFIKVSGYERYIYRLITNYGLSDNVVFLGPLTAEQLCQEMVSIHAVVISSLIETQCLVLLEAMMLGVPTLASYAGGMPDLFTNMRTAIGYPVGDSVTLAYSIRRIFNDDSLATKLSESAFQLGHERNDVAKCTDNMKNIYQQVLEDHKRMKKSSIKQEKYYGSRN